MQGLGTILIRWLQPPRPLGIAVLSSLAWGHKEMGWDPRGWLYFTSEGQVSPQSWWFMIPSGLCRNLVDFPHNHPTKRIQPGTDPRWEKTCKDNKLFCFNQKHGPWCREGSWGHTGSPPSPIPPPSPACWGLALQPLPLACPHFSLGTQAGPCCCAAIPCSRLEHTAPLAPRGGHRAQARTLSAHNPPLTQLVRRPFEAFFQLTA